MKKLTSSSNFPNNLLILILNRNQTMTIVQIENIDMINSHGVEVASTITVESTGGNPDKKTLAETNARSPMTTENPPKHVQSCSESQDASKIVDNSTSKSTIVAVSQDFVQT